MGEQVLSTRRALVNVIGDDRVDSELVTQWATSTQNLLVRVFGADSVHFQNFKQATSKYITFSPARRAMGTLRAAKDDYEHGYLFDTRRLIEADVFDDFLDQAEHLLGADYYQAAAVIAGAVLEDGLRKLCIQDGISLPANPKLDRMNADLAKKGTYGKLTQKQVTSYADIRNKAAHGEWDQFTQADVVTMLQGVRAFMEKHFA